MRVLFPRNPTPLIAANELWDVISINTTLVSTDTHFVARTHTQARYIKRQQANVFTCQSVNGERLNGLEIKVSF